MCWYAKVCNDPSLIKLLLVFGVAKQRALPFSAVTYRIGNRYMDDPLRGHSLVCCSATLSLYLCSLRTPLRLSFISTCTYCDDPHEKANTKWCMTMSIGPRLPRPYGTYGRALSWRGNDGASRRWQLQPALPSKPR